MENRLLIASGNYGKIQEIKDILSCFKDRLISTRDIPQTMDVAETGETYAENARLKAKAYLKLTGLSVLADDSGLEVDVLHGAPGVYSARFSPKEDATDADRREYLLQKLADKPKPWTAHFHCTAVLAVPGGELIQTVGRCDGIIIPEERGSGGFGYDPIFYLPEFSATMAELTMAVKNKISHRGKALSAMMPVLIDLMKPA